MATIARRFICHRFSTKTLYFTASRQALTSKNRPERHLHCLRHCSSSDTTSSSALKWRYFSDEASTSTSEILSISISDSCVKQLKKITSDDSDKNSFLRVMVEGGGCSGFQYTFNLDTKQEPDDRVFEREGVKVVVDETSLEILNGSTIDYHKELIRSAFRVINNPKAEMGCSCGVSFSLKI